MPAKRRCETQNCRGKIPAGGGRRCSKCKMRAWRKNNPVKAAYGNLRSNARRRKIAFSITLEEFAKFVTDNGYIESKGCLAHCLHLDRIDSSKGYMLSNLQVLTCSENALKANYVDKRKQYVPYFRNLEASKQALMEAVEQDYANPFGEEEVEQPF